MQDGDPSTSTHSVGVETFATPRAQPYDRKNQYRCCQHDGQPVRLVRVIFRARRCISSVAPGWSDNPLISVKPCQIYCRGSLRQ